MQEGANMFPRVLYYLYKLQKSQWLNSSEIQKAREKRLRFLIMKAYNTVPYYHRLFDSIGVRPDEIKEQEDLEKIPFLTKEIVKENYKDMFALGYSTERYENLSTCGTTGEPVKFYCDRNALDVYVARKMRVKLACGMKPRDKWVNVAIIREQDPGRYGERIVKGSLRNLLKNFFFKGLDLSIFDHPRDHVGPLIKFQPDVIQSYASHLRVLAQVISEKRIEEIKPRLIFQTSELLGEGTRETVESVFGVKIFDIYGLRELGGEIAWECPEHEGYHLNNDCLALEFIDLSGEPCDLGGRGELVVTTLYNRAMPLIRYRTGDTLVTSNEKCSCGRGLPLAKRVEGRNADFIIAPNAKLISPYFMESRVLENIRGLREYQIIQEKIDRIIVRVSINETFSESSILEIKERIQELMGADVEVVVISTHKILPRELNSGKLRVTVSKVSLRKFFGKEKYYEEYLYNSD